MKNSIQMILFFCVYAFSNAHAAKPCWTGPNNSGAQVRDGECISSVSGTSVCQNGSFTETVSSPENCSNYGHIPIVGPQKETSIAKRKTISQ